MDNLENPILLVRPFIKNLPEDTIYFCNPDAAVVVFPETSVAFIDPHGEVSLTYDKELNLVCPIKKQEGKIYLLPDITNVHTPYHENNKRIQELIQGWLSLNVEIETQEGKGESLNLPYYAMEVLALEATLADWFAICETTKQDPLTVTDIQDIKKFFLEKTAREKNKGNLLEVWSNLEVSLHDYEDEHAQDILKELHQAVSERLIILGSKKPKKKVKKLYEYNLDELNKLLLIATEQENFEGPEGAIAIRDEIGKRTISK